MPHAPRRRVAAAFTLAEVLCVVVILGVVGAVVGGHLGARGDLTADAAARVLVAHLQFAQDRAVSKRRPHLLVFEADGSAVTVCAPDDAGNLAPVPHPVEPGPMRIAFGPDGAGGGRGVTVGGLDLGGGATIGYDAGGEPITAALTGLNPAALASPASITLQAGDFEAVVAVEPVTGEAILR